MPESGAGISRTVLLQECMDSFTVTVLKSGEKERYYPNTDVSANSSR